jgi:hypothetical protein
MRKFSTRSLRLVVALLALAAATHAHADAAGRRFEWEQANTLLAEAHTPDDFLAAAQAYNRLVQDGVRNGPLFFNLGTALLLAGDGENATAALLRAERYSGSSPDLRTNLRLALAAKTGQPDIELPWNRVVFFWHFDHAMRVRIAVALAGWTLLWLGLLLRRLVPATVTSPASHASLRQAFAGPCVFFGVLMALVFGASVMVSFVQERMDERAWPERTFSTHVAREGKR